MLLSLSTLLEIHELIGGAISAGMRNPSDKRDSKETMKDDPAVRIWMILPPVLREGD